MYPFSAISVTFSSLFYLISGYANCDLYIVFTVWNVSSSTYPNINIRIGRIEKRKTGKNTYQ